MKLTNNDKSNIASWKTKNLIPSTNNGDIIPKRHLIYEYIVNGGDYSKNTQKAHLLSLAKVLRIEKKFLKDAEKYIDKSIEIKKSVIADYTKQILTKAQAAKFLTYPQLLEVREKLENQYTNFKLYKNHQKVLLLSLYTLQPPLRKNDYLDMLYYTKAQPPPNNLTNYLWKHRQGYTLIIQSDKTSNAYGRGEIDIEDLDLIKLLEYSFRTYPRKYVLSGHGGFNVSLKPTALYRMKKEIFNEFSDREPDFNLFRVAYVTHLEQLRNRSWEERVELARKMRNSLHMQQLVYNKFNHGKDMKIENLKVLKLLLGKRNYEIKENNDREEIEIVITD